MKILVTGATGLVGRNMVEHLAKNKHDVRAFVRETSHKNFLRRMGVDVFVGNFFDPQSLKDAVKDIDIVFHCAAMVSDWASREDMIRENVTALRNLLEACVGLPLKRFVHLSSLAVLGMNPQADTNERAPFVYTGDNYNYAKIEAEKVARDYVIKHGVPVVVLRPPYIYGKYDRHFLPPIVDSLRRGVFTYIDHGKNPISLVSVDNLVEAMIQAAKIPHAVGQVYHITDGVNTITRKELIELICNDLYIEKPKRSIPASLAFALINLLELIYLIFRLKKKPILNRFRMKFLHTPLTFDITKARKQLGYSPSHPFKESFQNAVTYFKTNERC
ncbi:MAG: NAD-dependent epimerase/dehydratase family protein [Candidatus Omnitrophota bacterium]